MENAEIGHINYFFQLLVTFVIQHVKRHQLADSPFDTDARSKYDF